MTSCSVVIPAGLQPGDTLEVTCNGERCVVAVPPNVCAGQSIVVNFPSSTRRRWWRQLGVAGSVGTIALAVGVRLTHLSRLSSASLIHVNVVGVDRDPALAAVRLRSLVEAAHSQAHGLPFRLTGVWSDDAASHDGWQAVAAHCDVTVPRENLVLADGAGSGWAGLGTLDATAAREHGIPARLPEFCDAVRSGDFNQSGRAFSPAVFDLPLPTSCPAFVERALSSEHDVAFEVDGFARGDGYPRLFVHPAGAVSTAHVDGGDSYFWLRLLAGEKRILLPDRGIDLTLRAGEVFFGPVGLRHEVHTLLPSLSISSNYFPTARSRSGARRGRSGSGEPRLLDSFVWESTSVVPCRYVAQIVGVCFDVVSLS